MDSSLGGLLLREVLSCDLPRFLPRLDDEDLSLFFSPYFDILRGRTWFRCPISPSPWRTKIGDEVSSLGATPSMMGMLSSSGRGSPNCDGGLQLFLNVRSLVANKLCTMGDSLGFSWASCNFLSKSYKL